MLLEKGKVTTPCRPTSRKTSSCEPCKAPHAYGANFALRATGGETNHTLTLAELPEHQFGTQNGDRFIILSDSGSEVLQGGVSGYHITFEWATRTLGGGEPHNNMPPYLAQNIVVRAL